jgi:hypothetical protein
MNQSEQYLARQAVEPSSRDSQNNNDLMTLFVSRESDLRPLSSWKEIAAYVGKGVRTVQRWAREQDFPIHRPMAERRIVLAMPYEIDAWVLGNQSAASNGDGKIKEELAQAREENEELRKQLSELRAVLDKLGGEAA